MTESALNRADSFVIPKKQEEKCGFLFHNAV